MTRRIIDISLAIDDRLPTWPGDPEISITPAAAIDRGDPANVSSLRLGSHTGTHVDAPLHFIPGGAAVDALDLNVLVGDCLVVDLRNVATEIDRRALARLDIPPGIERILLQTRNSELWADRGREQGDLYPVALTADGAAWMLERNVRLVGIDHLSIESSGNGASFPVHDQLLSAGVVILEGLDLSTVTPNRYELVCLPLRLSGCDGAPARAVLIAD